MGTSRRSSFPVFQKVIQSHVKGSLHTLLHDTHYLLFQNGLLTLLIFLLFLFVFGAIHSHFLITTLLVILTSGIADAGRFVHRAIPQAAVLAAGSQVQSGTAVTAEHIAGKERLPPGIQGNRRLLLCMVSPFLPDSLGSFKLLGCNNL